MMAHELEKNVLRVICLNASRLLSCRRGKWPCLEGGVCGGIG